MPTTEVATIPLEAGTAIGDPNDLGAAVMRDTVKKLHEVPGCQQVYFGTLLEKPDVLSLMINWDALSSHQAFQRDPSYTPFVSRIAEAMPADTSASFSHVDFNSPTSLASAFAAPVTEVATFYFSPASTSSSSSAEEEARAQAQAAWISRAAQAAAWLAREARDSLGAAYGLTHERVERSESGAGADAFGKGGGGDGDGAGKAKAAVLVVGWSSLEAHRAFRETESFKENIGLLREGTSSREMYHVTMMEAVRE